MINVKRVACTTTRSVVLATRVRLLFTSCTEVQVADNVHNRIEFGFHGVQRLDLYYKYVCASVMFYTRSTTKGHITIIRAKQNVLPPQEKNVIH